MRFGVKAWERPVGGMEDGGSLLLRLMAEQRADYARLVELQLKEFALARAAHRRGGDERGVGHSSYMKGHAEFYIGSGTSETTGGPLILESEPSIVVGAGSLGDDSVKNSIEFASGIQKGSTLDQHSFQDVEDNSTLLDYNIQKGSTVDQKGCKSDQKGFQDVEDGRKLSDYHIQKGSKSDQKRYQGLQDVRDGNTLSDYTVHKDGFFQDVEDGSRLSDDNIQKGEPDQKGFQDKDHDVTYGNAPSD